MVTTRGILAEVENERQYQLDMAFGGNTDAFDRANSRNDWVAYISAYAGRAADKCFCNERAGLSFRRMMVKVAALAVAAIEAHDKGWLEQEDVLVPGPLGEDAFSNHVKSPDGDKS